MLLFGWSVVDPVGLGAELPEVHGELLGTDPFMASAHHKPMKALQGDMWFAVMEEGHAIEHGLFRVLRGSQAVREVHLEPPLHRATVEGLGAWVDRLDDIEEALHGAIPGLGLLGVGEDVRHVGEEVPKLRL